MTSLLLLIAALLACVRPVAPQPVTTTSAETPSAETPSSTAARGALLSSAVALAAAQPTPIAELPLAPHTDPSGLSPQSLAVSPDGALLASGGADGQLRLFDASSGARLATLPGHSASITCVSFLGGDALITGDSEGEVRTWTLLPSAASQRLIAQHASPILALLTDPAGQHLVSVDARGDALAWDLPSRRPVSWLGDAAWSEAELSGAETAGGAFSPDGSLLALHLGGQEVNTYDTSTWTRVGGARWGDARGAEARAVAFTSDSTLRVLHQPADRAEHFTSSDWSARGDVHLLGRRQHEAPGVKRLDISPDGRWIAAVERLPGARGAVRLWREPLSPSAGVPLPPTARVLLPGLKVPQRVRFSSSGAALALGGGETSLNLISLDDPSPEGLTLAHPGRAAESPWSSPALLSDGGLAVIAQGDRVLIWRPPEAPTSIGLRADALALGPDDTLVGLGDQIWLLDVTEAVVRFERYASLDFTEVNAVSMSPAGGPLLVGDDDGLLRTLDPSTGEPLSWVLTGDDALYSLCQSPSGERLASLGNQRRLRIRALGRVGTLIELDPLGATEIMGWGGERLLLTGEGSLRIYDLATARWELVVEGVSETNAALSTSGRWLAWADDSGAVLLRDLDEEEVWRLPSPDGPVHALALDASGERLLVTRGGGLARLWSVATLTQGEPDPSLLPEAPLGPPRALRDGEGLTKPVNLYPLAHGLTVTPEPLTPGPLGRLPTPGGVMALSPDGARAAWASGGGLSVWRGEALEVELPSAHRGSAELVAWSPDGARLAVASTDQLVRVFDATTLELVQAWRAPGEVQRVLFVDEGRVVWFAEADADQPSLVLGLADGGQVALHRGPGPTLGFARSPVSDTLAASIMQDVHVFSLTDGALVAVIPGLPAAAELRFTPDGQRLLSAHLGGPTLAWDVSWLP